MKNWKTSLVGICTILVTLGLNIQYAFNDYGVLKNKLHIEILAQTNSNGNGSNSDGSFSFNGQGWNTTGDHWFGSDWYPTVTDCTHTTTYGVPPYQVGVSYEGRMVKCTFGNGNCFNGTSCIAKDSGSHS